MRDMGKKRGILYGVGVGPGDPELLTLKAARILRESTVIAVPNSDTSMDGKSRAYQIAEGAVAMEGKETLPLVFPMTKDASILEGARRKAASDIAERLNAGLDVVFITLGDPMLYSTFSYLVPFVRAEVDGLDVRVVPGVTSFCAAASKACVPLAEANESLVIIPAAYDLKTLRSALEAYDTVVIMKVNKKMDELVDLIESTGRLNSSFFATRVGWEGELIVTDLKSLRGARHDYFSTLIVKRGI